MSEERSAATTLFPNLPSALAPVDRAAPDPGRSVGAASIYGSPEGGIDRARSVIESGVAKPPAGETDTPAAPAGLPSNDQKKDAPLSLATPFDAAKFSGADPALIGDFGKIAGKANISQETAGELMALHNQTSERYWLDTEAAWSKQSRADAEIGGDKLDSEVVPAVRELLADKNLVDPELFNLLVTYRLASHPAVLRTLYRLARAL